MSHSIHVDISRAHQRAHPCTYGTQCKHLVFRGRHPDLFAASDGTMELRRQFVFELFVLFVFVSDVAAMKCR